MVPAIGRAAAARLRTLYAIRRRRPPLTLPPGSSRRRRRLSSSPPTDRTAGAPAPTTIGTTAAAAAEAPSSSSSLPPSLRNDNPFMNRPRQILGGSSLSQASGHASFVLAVGAYLATDILDLRCMVSGATALAMAFQYYRPAPLAIPLKWNTLLLGVNVAMATSLYLERRRAERMDGEMEALYMEGSFERRGFSRVEFCRLFGMAVRKELEGGEILVREGRTNDKMYLLASGNVVIKSGGKRLAIVTPHQFIGEMTFLDFMLAEEEDDDDSPDASSEATADVVVDAGGATVWEWDFEELRTYLRGEHEVANALQAYISYDLRSKLAESNITMLCRSYTTKRE